MKRRCDSGKKESTRESGGGEKNQENDENDRVSEEMRMRTAYTLAHVCASKTLIDIVRHSRKAD